MREVCGLKTGMKQVAVYAIKEQLIPIQSEMKVFREQLQNVKAGSGGSTDHGSGGGTGCTSHIRKAWGKADPHFPRYLVVKGWTDWTSRETQMSTTLSRTELEPAVNQMIQILHGVDDNLIDTVLTLAHWDKQIMFSQMNVWFKDDVSSGRRWSILRKMRVEGPTN